MENAELERYDIGRGSSSGDGLLYEPFSGFGSGDSLGFGTYCFQGLGDKGVKYKIWDFDSYDFLSAIGEGFCSLEGLG